MRLLFLLLFICWRNRCHWFYILLFLSATFCGRAATTNSITQYGITFNFASSHEYGLFADGSYWVVGPVTVNSMTPAWDGTKHGWEVNPLFAGGQGFTTLGVAYSSSKRPALPLVVNTNETLVKTIGLATSDDASWISVAVPLTVLVSEPSGGGDLYFRPPYVGTNKPLYLVSDLRDDLLPSMVMPSGAPTLAEVEANFSEGLRMDHHSSQPRDFRPRSIMNGYQPKNTAELNVAMLRLMGNESYASKEAAVVQFTQHALDRLYAVMGGYRRVDDGHNPNHRVLAAWAAVMLDITDGQNYLTNATDFHEDRYLFEGVNTALWGEPSSELNYWKYVAILDGGRSNKDPYGYIDGGRPSSVGASYQNITSQSLKGQALVYRLFPELRATVVDSKIATMDTYVERWVTAGTWYVPDPAAPYDGTWPGNYGATYGPDGLGSYIAGSGRGTSYHGQNVDGGQYKSTFVASMWDAYADVDPSAGTLQIGAATYSVSEAGGGVTITITRIVGSAGAVSVDYHTTNGTGTASTHYTATNSTANWADGVSTSHSFYVPVIDNGDTEGNKTFSIVLSNIVTATYGTFTNSTVTIEDDDVVGTLALSSATYTVNEDVDSGGVLTITVTRSVGVAGAVGVSYVTTDITAVAGSDYTSASGTLSWADDEGGSKTVDIIILDDEVEESDETFRIGLHTFTGGVTIGAITNATATIENDDVEEGSVPLMAGLTWDAEDGLIEAPFQVVSGQVYQTADTSPIPTNGGLARWRFTIVTPGTYYIIAAVDALSTARDSFFVQMNAEPETPTHIWDIPLTVGVEDRTVSWRGVNAPGEPEFSPVYWTLSAGEHTLYFRGREGNTKLNTISVVALNRIARSPRLKGIRLR